MNELEAALTWILGGGILLAATAACLIVGGLLRAALGGGVERGEPIPPGVLRHAAAVSSRMRAHLRARSEAASPG